MALDYQSDLSVVLPNEKNLYSTLKLSPTGDIQLFGGADKLVVQLVRAIVNDESIITRVNNKTVSSRIVKSLIVNILRNYRQEQIRYLDKSDPDLTGYSIWRKASGTDESFIRVSGKGIKNKFVDTDLENGTEYKYGITRIYQNTLESKFVDIVSIMPSAHVRNQGVVVSKFSIFYPEDRQVTIYVDFRKLHRMSELLDSIERVNVSQDTSDPRKYNVSLVIKNLLGSTVSVSSTLRIRAT